MADGNTLALVPLSMLMWPKAQDQLDHAKIDLYVQKLKDCAKTGDINFDAPPISVRWFGGGTLRVVNGCHRCAAMTKSGMSKVILAEFCNEDSYVIDVPQDYIDFVDGKGEYADAKTVTSSECDVKFAWESD
mmetsp:Transcript_125386/g.325685  ORF Transcript_125386/g.325685 Transcript_125386/m.325685 type:complete len:132 (+) Transcript_125386:78-473(+)